MGVSAKCYWLCDRGSLRQTFEFWRFPEFGIPRRLTGCENVCCWQYGDCGVQASCGNDEQAWNLSVWQGGTTQLTEAFVVKSARKRKGSHSIRA